MIQETDDRLKWLPPYVRAIASRMWLDNCTIHIEIDDTDEETYATVECTPGRHVATMRIGRTFWDSDQSSQRDTIVHEMIHVILRRVQDSPMSLQGSIGSLAFGVWMDRFDEETEYAVDHLTKLIAPSMPTLMEWSNQIAEAS